MEIINHSKIGASSADRFWECEGCIALGEKAKREGRIIETSKFAKEGTAAHMLSEVCLKEIDFSKAEDYIGSYIDVEDDTIIVTQEMANAVQVYLNYLKELISKVRGNYAFGFEKQFKLFDVDEEAFGTNDAFLFDSYEKKLTIIDYKHGKGVSVEVKNNKQLQYYALGALSDINVGNVEIIDIVIVQPRKKHPEGFIRSYTYSINELLKFKKHLKEKIQATKKSILELRAGAWCKFCPATLICPIVEKQIWKQSSYSISDAINDFNQGD